MRSIPLIITVFLTASLAIATNSSAQTSMVAESARFEIRSFRGGPEADRVLQKCEALRSGIQQAWFGEQGTEPWKQPCEIVLHSSRISYLNAVGQGGGQTVGSSLVALENGVVAARRIDLLVVEGEYSALAHELTHIVLADRFDGRRPPHWLDEGIATTSDSMNKQLLHWRDCHIAMQQGTAFKLNDLLQLEQLKSPEQVPAFYGQSLSFVHFLAERKDTATVVEFAAAASHLGYDRALKKYYDIDSISDLERLWWHYASTTHPSDSGQLLITDR